MLGGDLQVVACDLIDTVRTEMLNFKHGPALAVKQSQEDYEKRHKRKIFVIRTELRAANRNAKARELTQKIRVRIFVFRARLMRRELGAFKESVRSMRAHRALVKTRVAVRNQVKNDASNAICIS